MAERLIPGGLYVNETASRQALIGGSAYLDDTTSSDTNVALSGLAGTSALGSVGVGMERALSGVAGTAALGTLLAGNQIAFVSWLEIEFPTPSGGTGDGGATLTGLSASGTIGTLSPSSGATQRAYLSWVEIELPYSGAGGSSTVPLVGEAATAAIGTMSVAITKSVAGVSGFGQAGTLQAVSGDLVQLTGVAATGEAGTLRYGTDATLTGMVATGYAGTLAVALGETLGVAGILGPSSSFAAVGAVGTGQAGILSPSTESGSNYAVALFGVGGSGEVGGLGPGGEVPLPGVSTRGEIYTGFFEPEPVVVAPPADAARGGTPGRPQTNTRFRRYGPRTHLDVSHEDNWPEERREAPPPPRQAPPPAPRRAVRAMALPNEMPMLARPQAGPASFQAPTTPGQVANEFLATLDQLAREAGLDESVIADLQGIDAIDVSDVFNDME